MRKQIALALAVVIAVLSGCGPRPGTKLAEQTATDPSSLVAPSSPQTDLVCERSQRTPCEILLTLHGHPYRIHGHELNGSGWLCSDTGKSPTQYCVEEGSSIRFPDGHLVEGPHRDTYKGK